MIKKTIYKYDISTTKVQVLKIPEGAKILCVQMQFNQPKMWVLVDECAMFEERTFEVYGTGHLIEHKKTENRIYIGTYQVDAGNFIFHLFEVLKK